MPHIAIISASVRLKRNSHRVALYLKRFLEEKQLATAAILDLAEYNFPVFNERLRLQPSPTAEVIEFAEKIKSSDGVIMVTPEYNGGCPASLKNVIDLLNDEWKRKPVAFATVSAGSFGGMNVITSLQYSLWKMQAWTVPALYPVPKIAEAFNEQGEPLDKVATDKRTTRFIDELLWCIEAKQRMLKN
jgi:NAD(P)H-dependent FMN reductase